LIGPSEIRQNLPIILLPQATDGKRSVDFAFFVPGRGQCVAQKREVGQLTLSITKKTYESLSFCADRLARHLLFPQGVSDLHPDRSLSGRGGKEGGWEWGARPPSWFVQPPPSRCIFSFPFPTQTLPLQSPFTLDLLHKLGYPSYASVGPHRPLISN
jgi:hypothetical protein